MYMTNEDFEYHEQLFNSLDNSAAQDFMDVLLLKCSHMTGESEWMITVRSADEIAAMEVPENHIITRELLDEAYRAVTGGK